MGRKRVDVAIIGAGTAGLTARRAAKKQGASVALIDPGPYGTTCARVGCMPSKLLIAAAEAVHRARAATELGVDAEVHVDSARVLQRVQRERDRFVGFVLDAIDQARRDGELFEARARFEDAQQLVLDDGTRVEAKATVIASGSTPAIPPPFSELGQQLLTSDTVFELERLPDSALVVGAGAIGLELGQALARLGVKITQVSIDDVVGPLSDPCCTRSAAEAFEAEVDYFPSYALDQLSSDGHGVAIRFRDRDGAPHERSVERVLVAAGRRPNISELGLERTGVPLDDGKPIFDRWTLQLGDAPIFLAGDASGSRMILHEASAEGRIAGANAARYPEVRAQPRWTPLAIVFTDPQLAAVGRPFSELDHDTCHIGSVDYARQGRARVMGENRGVVRLYGDRTSCALVGAEMVGPRVEHTAQLLAWAIEQRMTVPALLAMPFYHPVIEEGIRTALRDLQANLRLARPLSRDACSEYGPGT